MQAIGISVRAPRPRFGVKLYEKQPIEQDRSGGTNYWLVSPEYDKPDGPALLVEYDLTTTDDPPGL